MSFDWFPWYPLLFRQKTYDLTLEEDGAYRRLIDEYMITRRPLPNDPGALARILGIPTADYNRIAPKVMRYFRMRNDKLWHKKCEGELRAQNTRHNRYSERGKKAAFAKYSKVNGLPATSMLVPATLQDKESILSSENSAARAREGPPLEATEIPKAAGSLATALLDGALTRPPNAGASNGKRPDKVGRTELEAGFARRRAANGRTSETE